MLCKLVNEFEPKFHYFAKHGFLYINLIFNYIYIYIYIYI